MIGLFFQMQFPQFYPITRQYFKPTQSLGALCLASVILTPVRMVVRVGCRPHLTASAALGVISVTPVMLALLRVAEHIVN